MAFYRFTEFKGYKKEDFPAAMNFIKHMFNQQKKEVEASPNYQGKNINYSYILHHIFSHCYINYSLSTMLYVLETDCLS